MTVKDLDFDELDRAVNSLMAGVPQQPVSSDQPSEKTLTIGTTPDETKQTNLATSSPVLASSEPKVSPPVSNTPAARRSGRFMDVVHPSSDMKKLDSGPSRPVSRQAATIEPERSPTTEQPTTPAAVPLEVPSLPVAPKPDVSPEVPAHSDWPDPLEMSGFGSETPVTADDQKKEAMNEKETSPIVPSREPEAPLTSPFLSDTKVDKRPLGANAIASTPISSEKEEAPEPAVAPEKTNDDDQLPATLEDTRPLLPEELHNDLMAIESDMTEPLQPAEESSPTATTSPSPTSEPSLSDDQEIREKSQLPKEEKPAIPTGPVSISQQYKEEPSSEEPKSGAIYDTDTYHQPLDHPAKQKSGWMWVVWIVLILLLGAGIGAALFLLRLV